MRDFLILKLQGPMQAWGEHTFEGLRPSANFPTRSGMLGLLGACLGIRRTDQERLQKLADSIGMAVRVDNRTTPTRGGKSRALRVVKVTDYHTVQDAREDYIGLKSHETIQTWREYLLDAEFTVAVWNHGGVEIRLDALEAAIKKPFFTPYLGRRACPLARPLFEMRLAANSPAMALKEVSPFTGTIYSEEGEGRMIRVRDVPLIQQPRQFAGRNLFVYGGEHVSE
jgi:CRISPR system Cascade subunit CasD